MPTVMPESNFNQTTAQNKLFVIGLPRTGTTSFCATMLEFGYSVAHTAYTKACFTQAQVLADTPIFCDYQKLASLFPHAQFVYLERPLHLWLPSIKQLLNRMYVNLTRDDGGFNPHIKRCYQTIFAPFTLENINNDNFLSECYLSHREGIVRFFESGEENAKPRLLTIDIAKENSMKQLAQFLDLPLIDKAFSHLNIGGKVTAWKDIKHPLKIESTNNGRVDKHIY